LPKADTIGSQVTREEEFVRNVLLLVVGSLCFGAVIASAENQLQYREYALGATLAAVAHASGTPVAAAKTLHERPAKIQELTWRAPYVASDAIGADPVRDILFLFYDDQLHQVIVNYERTRVEGLTDGDLIESLSAVYGPAVLPRRKARAEPYAADDSSEITTVARWERPDASLALVRGTFAPALQLLLTSKALNPRARTAITSAIRLDASEAPQRAIDDQKKRAAAGAAGEAKARAQNKATFRP
jgi:hypothetical protein